MTAAGEALIDARHEQTPGDGALGLQRLPPGRGGAALAELEGVRGSAAFITAEIRATRGWNRLFRPQQLRFSGAVNQSTGATLAA